MYAGFIYGTTLFLLLLLQIPGVAGDVSGTSNYIDIPGVSLLQISPSEFAKIGLIVILSAMLSELRSPVPELADVVRVLMVAGAHDGAGVHQRRDRHHDRADGDHRRDPGGGGHAGEAPDRAGAGVAVC